MKYVSVITALFAVVILGAQVTQTRLPNGNLELANRFVKVEVAPAHGARVVKLTDLRSGTEYAGGGDDMGIGGELDWQEKALRASQWFGKPYTGQFESLPDGKMIKCERTGTGSVGQWITIYKTYTLKENSSRVTLDYKIHVNPAAMNTLSFCLWLHNSAQIKNEPGVIRFVKSSGVTAIPFDSGAPLNESMHYDLADGWFAFSRSKAPQGLIQQVPYEDLMCFYNWQGQQGNTMEILYRSQRIPCGDSYNTSLDMLLYDGITSPAGSGNGLVGEFTANGIRLYASEKVSGEIAVSFREIPQKLENPVKTIPFDINAGECAEFPLPATPAGNEIIVRGKLQGKTAFAMRQPNQVKNYTRLAENPRRGSDKERFGQVILNEADKQDCYKWDYTLPPGGRPFLKPDAAGKLKMLVVTDMNNGREVTELANRMDADVTSATMSTNGFLNWFHVWGWSGGKAESNSYLGEALKKDYDVIILGGFQIDSIAKENLAAIADKVKKGTGLIAIMPSKIPAAYQPLFPVTPLIAENFRTVNPLTKRSGKYQVSADSPVKNFPFDQLEQVWLFPVKSSSAKITSNGMPFFSTGKFGKGRTAVFSYLTGRPDNTRRNGIAPYFATETDLPWHEYFFGMIIQASRWCAGREKLVGIEAFDITSGTGNLTIVNNLKRKVAVELEFTARHPGVKDRMLKVKKVLSPGVNKLTIPLDFEFYGGVNPVELRVSSDSMALDFAVAAVTEKDKAEVLKISAPDSMLLPGQPFKAQITTRGNYDEASYELIDPMGRIIAQGDFSGNEFEVTPQAVYARRADLYVTLKSNGSMQDRRRTVISTVPGNEVSRVWDSYNVMLGWPERDSRAIPFFLRDYWQNALSEVGINIMMSYAVPTFWGQDNEAKHMLSYRYGGRLVLESLSRLDYRSGIPGFNYPVWEYRNRKKEIGDIITNYSKTRNKFTIKRNPRLDDPEYLDAFANAMDVHMPRISKFRPFYYDIGDEMSYGEFDRPADFDFSPESLASFREWLKKRYNNDLAKLNREWKRSFKNWDEVVPDTGLEARERKEFSSWALHRIYNTTLFANFWKLVADKARENDPGALISASGTPAPHPYNGYDYELLMPVVDTLSAYTSQGTAEMLNSFKKLPLSAWVGYGMTESAIWSRIWNNAFNGHFGASVYNELELFNPDLTLTARGRHIKEAVTPLKEGAGALLYYTSRPTEAAVLASTPSTMAVWADYTFTDNNDAREIWVTLLKRAKCNVNFITPDKLKSGALTANGYKVLILPFALALSDEEISVIRDFAANGGIVFADVPYGVYNENVARRKKPVSIPGVNLIGQKLSKDYTTPLMVRVSKRLNSKLAAAGIGQSSNTLMIASGSPEIYPLQLCQDGGEVFGVWNSSKNASVKITAPENGEVYAIRAGKTVNGICKLEVERPEIFVALPYKVQDIQLQGSRNDRRISVDAQVTGSGDKVLRHVLRFRVFNADGKELKFFEKVCNAPDGKASFEIITAINENGPFSIEVTDVISKIKRIVKVD